MSILNMNFFSKNNYRYLIVMSFMNLLFMNCYFYFNGFLEWVYLYSWFISICSVIFDVFVLVFVFTVITNGRVKVACAITQFVTLIWSLINTFYGRFFNQYISLSAFAEAHSLQDDIVINSILSGMNWYDSFYLLSIFVFVWQYRKTSPQRVNIRSSVKMLIIPIMTLILSCSVYTVYHFIHPHYRHNFQLYIDRLNELLFDGFRAGTPNLAHFQAGSIRVVITEIHDQWIRKVLSAEQRSSIAAFYQDLSERTTSHPVNPDVKNVIFIILESFLSAPIDLTVDGKEITPFLNSLKRDSCIYYNGKMLSDITCGESGDGQFIYMNGILPLRSRITVGHIKNNTFPSLPKLLKEYYGINETEIYVPSRPNLWQQSDVNVVYGISRMYSQNDIDIDNPIDDEKIFKFASTKISRTKEPFFSMILSISGHNPYDTFYGEDITKDSKSFSKEYRNYLNTCHYTDNQLMRFIEAMKKKGIYDHSLIVIAADHNAHIGLLNMENQISEHIPLFIVNGYIDKSSAWNGEMRQLDVFTTILDVLNINSKWRGLGHTILSPKYHNSVSDQVYQLSEMIIEGDYFKANKDDEN